MNLLSGLWAKVLLVAAVLFAILGAVAKLVSTGRRLERADQEHSTLEVKDAQQKAAADAPRNRDDLVERLRRHEF